MTMGKEEVDNDDDNKTDGEQLNPSGSVPLDNPFAESEHDGNPPETTPGKN